MQDPFWHSWSRGVVFICPKHVNQRSGIKMNTPERRTLVYCRHHTKLVLHWSSSSTRLTECAMRAVDKVVSKSSEAWKWKGIREVLVPARGLGLVQPIPLADCFYWNSSREGNKCLSAILRFFMKRTFPSLFLLVSFLSQKSPAYIFQRF
jgi:hypothetical protein